MEIRSILVHLDIDVFSPALAKCAAELAGRFGAHLIGHAAAEPSPALVGVEGAVATVDWYAQERQEIEDRLRVIENELRNVVPPGADIEWRSSVEAPNRSLARHAQAADLIIVGSGLEEPGSYLRALDMGELVLAAGRPVLIVGDGVAEVKADKIIVGWKNSREARRAVTDALPFLKRAADVIVVTIDEEDLGAERGDIQEVLGWLRRHDVRARGDVYPSRGGSAATLEELGTQLQADLIVTGGYGHSRLREWLFGGMTRNLLSARTANRLMSN